jgi:hypothetical protein
MSMLREHLKKFHENANAHHNGLVACYKSLAAMTKASKSDMKDEDQTSELADCLDRFVAHHRHMADYHHEAMAECEKIAADDLNKNSSELLKRLEQREGQVVPSRISGVRSGKSERARGAEIRRQRNSGEAECSRSI